METHALTIYPLDSEASLLRHAIDKHNNWPGIRRDVDVDFAIGYDELALYVDFTTRNAPYICERTADQEAVCRDSCVEFFLQPDIDDPHYFNFEFNPLGVANASRRLDRHNATHLTADELALIQRIPGGLQPDGSWSLRVIIPWELLGVEPENKLPMRGNFQACSDDAEPPYYLSWAPIPTGKPDYHRPEYFKPIVLA